jgi:anti-sigma B factor antagonist
MEIFEQRQGSRLVISLKGKLDANTTELLEKRFDQIKDSTTDLSFDMSELKYISSAGLRVILTIMKEMKAKNGKFSVGHLNNEIRAIFNMVGFMDLFVRDEKYFIVVTEKSETKAVLKMFGSPDMDAARDFRTHIRELQTEGINEFVLDMTEITSITPRFVETLSEIVKETDEKGKLSVLKPAQGWKVCPS